MAKSPSQTPLHRLSGTMATRCGSDPASSYTAFLLRRGRAGQAETFGREAVELVITALAAAGLPVRGGG